MKVCRDANYRVSNFFVNSTRVMNIWAIATDLLVQAQFPSLICMDAFSAFSFCTILLTQRQQRPD